MKIDFSKTIKYLDGREIIIDSDGGPGAAATLKWVSIEALLHPSSGRHDDGQISSNDLIARYDLAQTLHNAEGEIEISVENVALIKRLIPQRFNQPVLAGPALKMLDGS